MRNDDKVADLIQAAVRQGWVVTKTTKGHLCFRAPDRKVPLIYGGGTPSDYRAMRNLRSMLRRHGLKV